MKDKIDIVLEELKARQMEIDHFIIIVAYRDNMPLAGIAPLNETILRTDYEDFGPIKRQFPLLMDAFEAAETTH